MITTRQNTYDVRVTVPQFDDPRHPEASEALNRSILDRFTEAQVLAQPLPGSDGSFDGNVGATYDDGALVALTLSIDSYSGGPHPNTQLETVLYDADRGREAHLEDLFVDKAGYLATLAQEVSQALSGQPDVDESFLEYHADARAENFAAFEPSADGLTFLLPAARMGPYPAGLFEARVGWDRLRPALDPAGPLWRQASDFDFSAHAQRGAAFERLAALRGPVDQPDLKRLPQAAETALDLLALVRAADGQDVQIPALTDQFVRLHGALGDGARAAFERVETGLRQGAYGARTREEVTARILENLALGASPDSALQVLPAGVPTTIQTGEESVTIGEVTLPAHR